MTALVISNVPPFGMMTNLTVADLATVNEAILRLKSAVATASSGWDGVDGAQFEGPNNNFGVSPSDVPGEQGAAYAYAVGNLANAWDSFWTAALASIAALDNGVRMP